MPYKLKASEPEFQVTREGKFEYKRFKHGEIYEEIPPEEVNKFEKVGAYGNTPVLQAEVEKKPILKK